MRAIGVRRGRKVPTGTGKVKACLPVVGERGEVVGEAGRGGPGLNGRRMEAFFMFHRALGSDDEMATVAERTEKLLFYTSSCDDDLEEQLERVSLCEAFIDLW